jgi:hypothetical protein
MAGRMRKHRLHRRVLRLEQLEVRSVMAADVIISEFLASNSGGLRDGHGDSSDWIELYNTTASPIDLSGYFLTDKPNDLDQWQFPSGTVIGANSTILVFASDKASNPPPSELHTNFKIGADGEFLGLVAPNGVTIIDAFSPEFPPQETNISYGVSMASPSTTLVDEATFMRYRVPTSGSSDATWMNPGFNATTWTAGTAGLGYEASPGSASNFSALLDAEIAHGTTSAYARFEFNVANVSAFSSLRLDMIYDDGFVAYLNGQLITSDNAPANPSWNSTSGPTLRSDEEIISAYVPFDITSHLNKLVNGTNVLAIHALNLPSSSDMLMTPRLVASAPALTEPLQYGSFATPTPNAINGAVFQGVVGDTSFSVDRGFYTSPFQVEVTTATPGATIVYTIDGSEPTVDANMAITNGVLYVTPINVAATTTLRAKAFKQGFVPTNVDTQTYIFVADVIQQTASSTIAAGFPSSWGGRSADYGMDPDVIGPNDLFGGVYASQIVDSLLAIPTISIVVDVDDFFGPSGIYSNPTGEGILWERPASAELIYPDGTEGFQIDAGLRVAGAASRTLSKKNGLRLLFKSEYGAGKLEFPLFGEGVQEFDTVVLRPHFNDGWGWDGALGDPTFSRDQWFRDTQLAMGHNAARGNLAHLYINGVYWGLYNPSERPDDSFNAEHLGGEKEEYDVMVADGVQDGTATAYNTMLAMAQSVISASGTAAKNAAYQLLQGNLPNGTNDPAAEAYLDVVNYIDYMLLNQYGGNDDWPDRNWYAARRQGEESLGFQFYAWDNEISLDLSDRTSLTENYTGVSTGAAQAYNTLRNYEEFRLQFADRIHHHLFNGGALYVNPNSPDYDPAHPENNVPAARFAEIADRVSEAIVAESARWGDQHVSLPRTKDGDWQPSVNYLLGTYFEQRHSIVLNHWRSAGLYPTTDAPEFVVNGARKHGGSIDDNDLLTFANTNTGTAGIIYYTTDGSDPRLMGGAVNTASALTATGALSFDETVTVKARILRNGQWSALTEATFVVPNADFDANNVVNGFDFLLWQRGFGTTDATPADGDADLDGDVDGDDLAAVEQQFGLGAPELVVAAITSPASDPEQEPAAAAPLLAASVSPTSPEMVPRGVRSTMLSGTRAASATTTAARDADLDTPARRRDASQSLRRSSARDVAGSADETKADDAVEQAFENWSKVSRFPLSSFAIRSSS